MAEAVDWPELLLRRWKGGNETDWDEVKEDDDCDLIRVLVRR